MHGVTVARALHRLLESPLSPSRPEPLTSAEIELLIEEYAADLDLSPAERVLALDWLDGQRQAEPPPL
jgi:hypothetical protein